MPIIHKRNLKRTAGFALNKLRPFLAHSVSQNNVSISRIAEELFILFQNKYQAPLPLKHHDLAEMKEALNITYRKLIQLPPKKSRKFERVLRDIVLSVENHATYNHVTEKIFFKSKWHKFHYLFSKKKHFIYQNKIKNAETLANNQRIDDMIDKAEDLSIVYITMNKINKLGHNAIKLGNQGYVQIFRVIGKPIFYTNEQWQKCLQFYNYHTLGIQNMSVPNLSGAKARLKELAHKKWFWFPIHHNCSHFAWHVMEAGNMNVDFLKKPYYPKEDLYFVPAAQLPTVPVKELIKESSKDKVTENGPKQCDASYAVKMDGKVSKVGLFKRITRFFANPHLVDHSLLEKNKICL